jgi:hypothetical protein
MLLFRAGFGPQARWCFGNRLMPCDDPYLAQPHQLDSAQSGCDPGGGGPGEAICRLAAAALIVGAIVGESIGDGIGMVKRNEAAALLTQLLGSIGYEATDGGVDPLTIVTTFGIGEQVEPGSATGVVAVVASSDFDMSMKLSLGALFQRFFFRLID